MDTTELEDAYERFHAAASAGGFEDPVGSWPASLVVAHVAANDDLIAAHIEAALAAEEPRYDNRPALDERRLRRIVEDVEGWDGLVELARHRAARVVRLAGDVDGALAGRPFLVFILDGDVVQVDGPVPIPRLIAAQSRVHIPAHTEELERLASALVTASGRA
jgi:hypothetical protein